MKKSSSDLSMLKYTYDFLSKISRIWVAAAIKRFFKRQIIPAGLTAPEVFVENVGQSIIIYDIWAVAKYICLIFFFVITDQGIVSSKESENEFVVHKKNKKESAAAVKEDIGEQLELLLRQTSKNIAEMAKVQQQIFDKIKDLVGVSDASSDEKQSFSGSTSQLKEQRHALKLNHQKLVQHHHDIENLLSCC